MQQRKERTNENIIYIGSIAMLCLLTVVFLIKGFSMYYSSIDDYTLLHIMNGNYTGRPDAHLIYIMYPLGLIFKSLYLLMPSVPWYEIFTISMPVIGLFFMTYRFWTILMIKRLKGWERTTQEQKDENMVANLFTILLFYLFLLDVFVKYMVESEYAMQAGFLMLTSLFCFATRRYGQRKFERALNNVIITGCFALGLWLRKEVCFMALPLFILIAVTSFLSFKKDEKSKIIIRRDLRGIITQMVLFAAIILLSLFIENLAYSSQEWKEYLEFNKARLDVYEYGLMPEYKGNEAFYSSLGISEDEYTVMKEYALNLVPDANTENFEKMSLRQQEIMDKESGQGGAGIRVIKDTADSMLENLRTPMGIMMAVLFTGGLIGMLVWGLRRKNWFPFIQILVTVLYAFGITAYFATVKRMPEQVYLTIDFLCIAGVLSAFCDVGGRPKKKNLEFLFLYTATGIFVIVFTGVIAYLMLNGSSTLRQNAERCEIFNEHYDSQPDDVFFVSESVFSLECEKMFKKGWKERKNVIMMVDWCYNSPLERKQYENLGMERSPAVLLKNNVYFVLEDSVDINLYEEMLEVILNRDIAVKREHTFEEPSRKYNIWKFSLAEE